MSGLEEKMGYGLHVTCFKPQVSCCCLYGLWFKASHGQHETHKETPDKKLVTRDTQPVTGDPLPSALPRNSSDTKI